MDRDTLFAGNPELYYTIGNASTMISAMALPLSGILKGATGAAKFKTIAVDGGRILIGNVAEDKVIKLSIKVQIAVYWQCWKQYGRRSSIRKSSE